MRKINCTYNRVIRTTPYELFIGYHPLKNEIKTSKNTFNNAYNNSIKHSERNNMMINRRRKTSYKYKPNDMICVKTFPSIKLDEF